MIGDFEIIKFKEREVRIFLRDDADKSVVAEIFKWREYRSVDEIVEACNLPILDVGAHVGIFSLYAKILNPDVKIYALEPEADNFSALKKNVEENNFARGTKLFKVALAEKTGVRKLQIENDSINHHLRKSLEKDEDSHYEEVRVISFGDFLIENGVAGVGLLKMDIEGGEYEIFENLLSGDFARIKNIILEYHNYCGRNYREIENILRKNGFGVQIFPSRFENDLGFLLAKNKRNGK
ncbi:MAG: FkbM family methyltransferase [Candidatus Pacebacteria bacterium]|nr:FkbM family methyltransferase [Candidatus Paceibacterota bacterium]